MALSQTELASPISGEIASHGTLINLSEPEISLGEREPSVFLRSTVRLSGSHLQRFSNEHGFTLDQMLGIERGSNSGDVLIVQEIAANPHDIDTIIKLKREALNNLLGMSEREQDEEQRVIWEVKANDGADQPNYFQISNPFKRYDYSEE